MYVRQLWFEKLVNTDISILGFYGYIGKTLVRQKLFKIHGNIWKTLKNDKISKNRHVKVIL